MGLKTISFVTKGAVDNDFIYMVQCGSNGCLSLMLLKLSSGGEERRDERYSSNSRWKLCRYIDRAAQEDSLYIQMMHEL